MTIKEKQKRDLNAYSKEQLIDALLLSGIATGFVLEKCKALYNDPKIKEKRGKNTPNT